MALPRLDDVDDLDAQHLLVLPSGIGPESVEILATSRFPRATWEHPAAPPQVGARAPRLPAPPGVLRLSRLTTLAGPYQVDRGTATELGLPVGAGTAYLLQTPTERGNPPWAHASGDRDGLARAFPDGLPVRDEARMLDWAIAVARRLAGAVRVAATNGRPPVVLTPDPAAAVDLTVWSDHWLDPDTALAAMRQAIPRAYLNLPRGTWQGPPAGTGEHRVPGTEPLTDAQRAWLHAEADAYDREMLANPAPMDTYGLLADLDLDGFIALEIAGEPSPPPVVAELPWAASGAVAYRVRWEPVDEHELEQERPSLAHRVARGRAAPLVVAVARAVHGKVGGEITDMMGFVVDPADL